MGILNVLSVLILIYGLVATVYMFATKKQRAERDSKLPNLPFGKISALVGVTLLIILSMIVKIGPQDVGVLVRPNGVSEKEMHTGWHIVMPWNSVHEMDKTVWVYTCAKSAGEGQKADADEIWAPTSDGIKMGFDVSVSWRIDPDNASWIYQNVTENDDRENGRYIWLEENVIRPKLKSAMALVVSKYTPIQAYSFERENIQKDIFKKISEEIGKYNLILDQVDVREVYYNKDFEKAINDKKLSEQKVLDLKEITKQKEELLKQAEINKNIQIESAKAEAEAIKIKGDALNKNPQVIQLEWIQKWDGQLPTYMMGNGQGVILNLPNK